MKNAFFLLICSAWIDASAASDPQYFWFKNEMQCADAKVTVRSYCEASAPSVYAVVHRNTMCTEQQLLIERPGKKKVRRNLLEHERRDYLTARSLSCVKSGDTTYLYVSLANGGNCNTCESDAILDMSGRWVRDGRRWFASGAVKRGVNNQQESWYKQDSLRLINTLVDPDQD